MKSTLPREYEDAKNFIANYTRTEVDAIGAILSNHPRGIGIAEGAGVVHHCFKQEDLRIIYLACEFTKRRAKIITLELARAALRAAGRWEPGRKNFKTSMNWSNESLCALAHSWPDNDSIVDLLSRRLVEADWRLRDAEQAYSRFLKRLREPFELWAPGFKVTERRKVAG